MKLYVYVKNNTIYEISEYRIDNLTPNLLVYEIDYNYEEIIPEVFEVKDGQVVVNNEFDLDSYKKQLKSEKIEKTLSLYNKVIREFEEEVNKYQEKYTIDNKKMRLIYKYIYKTVNSFLDVKTIQIHLELLKNSCPVKCDSDDEYKVYFLTSMLNMYKRIFRKIEDKINKIIEQNKAVDELKTVEPSFILDNIIITYKRRKQRRWTKK